MEAMDLSMQEAATAAELRRKGGGIAYIFEELIARGVLQAVASLG